MTYKKPEPKPKKKSVLCPKHGRARIGDYYSCGCPVSGKKGDQENA